MSINSGESVQFLDAAEVQIELAKFLRKQREAAKLTRAALAEVSLVPAATIKKFELTGQISLRQLLLLWQSVDDLSRFMALVHEQPAMPASIDEVLRDDI